MSSQASNTYSATGNNSRSVANRNFRVPPHNLEAEMAVLGAMMLGGRASVERAVSLLMRADFYRDAHAHIYDAMTMLAGKGEPVDIVTLKDELQRRGVLDGIGGVGYLMQLDDIAFTIANLEHYAKIVSDKATLRRMIDAASEIATAAFAEADDADALIEQAEARFLAIRPQRGKDTARSLKQRAHDEMEAIEQRGRHRKESGGSTNNAGRAILGIPTGFHGLDWYLSGLKRANFILLAARPSVGKTALAACIAANVTRAGHAVALFTLEMSGQEMAQRILTAEGRVDSHSVSTGQMEPEDWKKILAGADRLCRGECIIDDNTTVTPAYLRAKLRRIQAEHGLDLVVIDYIGLMSSGGSGSGRRNETRNEELSQISRSLKLIAKEFDVPVLALAQLNRGVEQRTDKRPLLSDLRDSGSLEQDADAVMFLHRDSYQSDDAGARDNYQIDPTEVIIRKQRNGPTGTLQLGFTPAYARFENLVNEPGGDL